MANQVASVAREQKEDDGDNTIRRRIIRARRPPTVNNNISVRPASNVDDLATRLSEVQVGEGEGDRDNTHKEAAAAAAAVDMKLCAACSQELPRNKYSKKQWQLKQQRRCKECIADNREVNLLEQPTYMPLSSSAESEVALCWADDKDLFKQPPPREECPICFLPPPLNNILLSYKSCCGKILCMGCVYHDNIEMDRHICPFCRTPPSASDLEYVERLKKRVDAADADAIFQLGSCYKLGMRGLPQDYGKANKFWLGAGELGHALAHNNLANAYENKEGVERDTKKAEYYYELAAMGGDVEARRNLGVKECNAGSMNRAMKHWMISAGAGDDESLNVIRECFLNGHATKDDFERALRAHKEATVRRRVIRETHMLHIVLRRKANRYTKIL